MRQNLTRLLRGLSGVLTATAVGVMLMPLPATALPNGTEVGGRMTGQCVLDGADTDKATWDACCARYATNCVRNCESMGNPSGTCTDLCDTALSECMSSFPASVLRPTTRPTAPTSPGFAIEPSPSPGTAPELELLLK